MSDTSSVIQDYDSNAGFDSDQDFGSDTEMAASYSQADDDEDYGFMASQQSQSQSNSLPTFSFKSLTLPQIIKMRKDTITDVAALLGVNEPEADILLRHYSWKRSRLTDDFLDDSNKVINSAGIQKTKILQPKIQLLPDFECQVCFSTSAEIGSGRRPKMPTFSLSCGHGFCQDCYKHYLESKVDDGELEIVCMDEDCKIKIEENVLKLLIDENLFDRYKRLLVLSFVQHGLKDVKWCVGPDCPGGIQCDVSPSACDVIIPTVDCENCQTAFCFGCGFENHSPSICSLVKKWEKKMKDDSETAKWLQTNTKDCPGKGCGKSIEKNGGCNHMSCRDCKWEFCWICMGDWISHNNNYQCNRFVPEDSAKQDSRISLARYLHYFDRFNNHNEAAKLDLEFFEKTEEKMKEIQETTSLTWIETRYCEKAVKAVVECRRTLKWSYCFAFYLEKGNMTELFEDNQRDLERAVEELSYALERPIEIETIPKLKAEITDLSNYVATRRRIILEDATQGLQEGRLKWVERL